jgi:hypothetical protein
VCPTQASQFRGTHVDQLATPRQQRRQLACGGIRQRPQLWPDHRRELRQHLRIQRIGLRQTTRRPCEVAHLAWVDRHGWQAGAAQRGQHRRLIPAAGFQDDQCRCQCRQALDELRDTGVIVAGLPLLTARIHRYVERGLADVDAHPSLLLYLVCHDRSARWICPLRPVLADAG